MKRCCLEAMFVLLILFARPAAAQQPADGGNADHEMIRQLLQRVQQLEA